MANGDVCNTCKRDIRAVVTELLELLNKPRADLSLIENVLLQQLEIAALLCDELGPEADFLDSELELLFCKLEAIGVGCRRILLDRAKRRESRAARS
jgi:hypothetical protein